MTAADLLSGVRVWRSRSEDVTVQIPGGRAVWWLRWADRSRKTCRSVGVEGPTGLLMVFWPVC